MGMRYGERNQMQSFRAVEARTTTEPRLGVRGERPAITQSKVLTAEFHPQTGEMERIEQVQDFVYESGDRRARAAKAILHPQREWIELETEARVWDPSGSTSADRIQIDQGSGDFTAEGRVNSSREPEKQKSGSEMLAGEEPLQAIARKMRTANRNQRIDYEGDVTLWQGGNRVEADHVTIDREARTLTARRKVLTQFIEESKPGYTVVRAGHLVYTEGDRLAHYTGGAVLTRGGLHVKSAVLRAFLAEQGSDSRIEKAYADGGVEIQERSAERTRTGKAEHAEYYAGEQKILLKGGNPELADSRRGLARGAELTYYAGDDRLLINGAPGRPAVSRIKRK